jgi:hypothetical protein
VSLAAGAQQKFTATVSNNANGAVTWLVNNVSGGNSSIGTITNDGTFTARLDGGDVLITAIAQADGHTAGSANVTVLPPHAIGVRSTASYAEFFDRATGQSFVPRGNAYVRLGYLRDNFGRTQTDHTTFIVGMYDSARSDAALSAMQSNGYNVTRVFMNGCCVGGIGDPQGGINGAYVANVIDFLRLAKKHNIKVMLTHDWLPGYGGYGDLFGPCWPQYEMNNLNFLSSCGIAANVKYYDDFVRALVAQRAPLDTVFSFELRSEYTYDAAYAPLTLTAGSITTANGKTYDLGDNASRQTMMDDGLIYFVDQVASAVRIVDPTALVSIGFFAPQEPNPYRSGDERLIKSWPAVAGSTADFVGIHPYPILGGLTLAQYIQNFGFVGYQQKQPVIMEEFGAFQTDYSEQNAAVLTHDWQVQSCVYGIKGWLFWTWDTPGTDQPWPPTWPAFGGTGVINDALAPVNRPDACAN